MPKRNFNMEKLKTYSVNIKNEYEFDMKEILEFWNENGFDISHESCEAIVLIQGMLKIPKLAKVISNYKMYLEIKKNGLLENGNEVSKFDVFLQEHPIEDLEPFTVTQMTVTYEKDSNIIQNNTSFISNPISSNEDIFSKMEIHAPSNIDPLEDTINEDDIFENFMDDID